MGGARQRRDLGREDARGRMGERGRGDAGMGAWSVASECPHSRGKGAASSVRPRRSPARPIQPLERGFQGSVRSPAKAGRGPRASLHPTASTCSRARLVSRRRDLRLPAQRRSQPCNTGARKTPGPPGLRGVLPPRHVGVGMGCPSVAVGRTRRLPRGSRVTGCPTTTARGRIAWLLDQEPDGRSLEVFPRRGRPLGRAHRLSSTRSIASYASLVMMNSGCSLNAS